MDGAQRARNALVVLLLIGTVLVGLGAALIGANYPHRVTYDDGGYSQTGSWGPVVTGGIIGGVGQAMLLVALIGYGVRLGIAAGARSAVEEAVADAEPPASPITAVVPAP